MSSAQLADSSSSGAASGGGGREVIFSSISKSFGSASVLRDMDLHIGAGELVTVLGPSGCGKTTALRILAGFEKPSSGQVLIDGKDITTTPANKRGIGMVFQSYSLFPNLSVQENVEYGLRVRRVDRQSRARRAREMLEICGLEEFANRYPHQLSGGQQQRVALARALATEPEVLVLDEPLSALDAIVRVRIREEIRRLQRKLGITTLFVTHDQEEALSIADRVAVLKDGVIEQLAVPQQVYQRPATEFVARFVGTVTELGVAANFARGELPIQAPGPGRDTLFVRPEDIALLPDDTGSCTVVSQVFTGERTIVRATSPIPGLEVTSSVSATEAGSLIPGTRVSVAVMEEPALRIPAENAQAEPKVAAAAGGSRS